MNNNQESSLSLTEACEQNLLFLEEGAVVDPSVRLIATEDDGNSYGRITVGAGSVIRAGAIICSGVQIGCNSVIGHHVVVRRQVCIGSNSVISHMVCLERNTVVGNRVRISALTHITGDCVIEDDVQIGARVVTVNDKSMDWQNEPELKPPIFRKGCKIGSGSSIQGGIEIGTGSIIGTHSLVTKNVPEKCVAYGTPAYVIRWLRD